MRRSAWDDAILTAESCYKQLIEAGVPAEDARGLMPHAMKTRLHWVTNLRGLLYVAGVRLCTQAQFEWRSVMAEVVKALRGYETRTTFERREPSDGDWTFESDRWQFNLMADRLQPVCYQTGDCKFMATDDRACAIRARVRANAKIGRESALWGERFEEGARYHPDYPLTVIEPINVFEWAADPNAARRTS
jgi:thymidylate synthase ThyX